jgi:DUF1365 family protein
VTTPAPSSSSADVSQDAGGGRASGLRSGIYEGRVVHHRRTPVDHRFTYRFALVLLDLSEVDAVCRLHPLWSDEGRNAVSFRRADYLGNPSVPLDVAVRDLVEERTGHRPDGPISVLTQLRTWGWLFNPITTYYCYDPTGITVTTTVVEVTNTPWHERTAYVLDGTGIHQVAKGMHVSPFLPMDLSHRFTIGTPGDRLTLAIDDFDGDALVFGASMALTRHPAGRTAMGRLLWRFPFMTLRVSLSIYRQALAIRRKGVPFHLHPDKFPAPPAGAPIDGQER